MGAIIEQEAIEFAVAWERAGAIIGKYKTLKTYLQSAFQGEAARTSVQGGLRWLERFEEQFLKLPAQFLNVESGNEAIRNAADTLAKQCERAIVSELQDYKDRGTSAEYRHKRAARLIADICQGAGVREPSAGDTEEKTIALLARLSDERWWRRQLRRLQAAKLETAARWLGAVNKHSGIYCSDATLYRRRGQIARNRELLEQMEAVNNEGQVYTLAELAELGVSNPVNRCNELLTRVRGFEEWAANDLGNWVPMFYTLTAPSRYHSHSRQGKLYPAWEKAGRPTPAEAMQWLSSVWVLVRSAVARAEIPYFGLRVVEPHHCGCPHFHILLWVPEQHEKSLTDIFWKYSIGADGDLPPSRATLKRRFTAKRIDPEKGSAVGYVVKYITKNVHGAKLNGDEFEAGAVRNALRVEAWATTWGIRQFQQIGGASVTVWRELRRLGDSQIADAQELDEIRAAANGGQYSLFTELMGGAVLKRVLRPLRAYMVRKQSEDGEAILNRYGELVRAIKGLMAWDWLPVQTRFYSWVIRPAKRAGLGFEAGASPPLDLCQ